MAVEAIAVAGRQLSVPVHGALDFIQTAILMTASFRCLSATLAETHATVTSRHESCSAESEARARRGRRRAVAAVFFVGLAVASRVADDRALESRTNKASCCTSLFVRCGCCRCLAMRRDCRCFHARRSVKRAMSGALGVIALLVLLTLGMPIGVAMGLVGMVGLTLLLGPEPALIKSGVMLFETVLALRARRAAAVSADGASVFRGRAPAAISSTPRRSCSAIGAAASRSPPSRAARASARSVDRALPRLRRSARRLARDAQARLFGCAGDRLDRRRRHARLAHAAVRRAHRLRHPRRAIDRQAVHRRHHSGDHADAVLHAHHRAAVPLAAFASAPATQRATLARSGAAALLRIADLAALVVAGARRHRASAGSRRPKPRRSAPSARWLLCAWRRRLTWRALLRRARGHVADHAACSTSSSSAR